MAAYIAAGAFNEGTASLLYYMSAIGLSLGPNAHSFAEKEVAQRVTISDRRAHEREEWFTDSVKLNYWKLLKEWRIYYMILE